LCSPHFPTAVLARVAEAVRDKVGQAVRLVKWHFEWKAKIHVRDVSGLSCGFA